MSQEIIDVVVRCRNEMPHAERTLESLLRQRGPRPRVLFLDCGSTDGSREAAARMGVRILDVDPSSYVPGAVLNRAMRETTGPFVAFVNADAVPLDSHALEALLEPIVGTPNVAASFGRQLARPDASPLVKLEYERAFGPHGTVALRRGRFFSMAASVVRRAAWEALPFDDSIRYSEDVDWTHRCSALGFQVRYAPEARFEHSHDYTPREQFRRRAGEGAADQAIFRLGPPSVLRDLVQPLVGAVVRDGRAGLLSAAAVTTRTAQAFGYFSGRWRAA